LVEQTKIRAYREATSDLERDPEFMEMMRDKAVADLLGLPSYPPRAREKGGHRPPPNLANQLDRMMHDIDQVENLKQRLGVNSNSWTKVLSDPNVIKTVLEIVKGLRGSSVPSQGSNAATNHKGIFVEINGKFIEMDYPHYMQYASQRKGLGAPMASPAMPGQIGQSAEPAAVNGDAISPLPPGVALSATSETPSVQPNTGDVFLAYLAKIVQAMDEPVEEFVQKTVASCQSGDQESLQIRDFLLAHKYDDVLKELSRGCGYLERFEKNRLWYDRVTEALRTQP
jgi:hypothetical protein